MLDSLSPAELVLLKWDWAFWARPEQLPPAGDWRVWLVMAGRGWGKTRTGAEWVLEQAREPGRRLAIVGETWQDARAVMVEGESGILACAPPWERPVFEASKRLLHWPNGSRAELFSADDPEQLRGPQFHAAWCDELAKWRRPESWSNLQFALRLGEGPKVVVTTTPRPQKLLQEVLALPGCVVTRGKTMDNAANLSATFLDEITRLYGGTRTGQQELEGELLTDVPGALWTPELVMRCRVGSRPRLQRVVVAVDPAVTGNGSETGIIVAGRDGTGRFYVLEDVSGRYSPDQWGREVLEAAYRWDARHLVMEVNNGGDLVTGVIRTIDKIIPIRAVRASVSKMARAGPVAALYEQGRVWHVGHFAQLEQQMASFTGAGGEESPDRLDALVWAITDLMQERGEGYRVRVV